MTPAGWRQAEQSLAAREFAAALAVAEPQYRAKPVAAASARFAAELLAAIAADCEAFEQAAPEDGAERLRHARLQIAASLAALDPDCLARSWSLFAPVHAALLKSPLRDFARTPAEDEFLEGLVALYPDRCARPAAPGTMLAAMLLARNFELPIVSDIPALPDWLRPIYFMELLASPSVFNRIGEAERYVDFLERVTDLVHRLWVGVPGAASDPVLCELAARYVLGASLIQAYFSTRNLRPLYRQRGEIIAAFLVSRGVQTLVGYAPTAAGSRIKLGIFVQHFTAHTETYFMLSHFEHLDRSRFEVTLYATVSDGNPLERYCVSRADRLVLLHPTDLVTQIDRIRADRLDQLLLGTNMTAVTNVATLLGSVRLARVQAASVSSPVTTGERHVDVMLSAEWNEPLPDAREHFTEQLELLPGSINYYAYQHDRDRASVTVSRALVGIADSAVVFFSGANFFKILPELSSTWARIVAQVPGSVLLLMPFNPNWSRHYQRLPFVARIREQLRAQGVGPERLLIINAVPTRADVHRVMGLADVYLDPFPFAGACSMLDSIIVGVPAVVRRGRVGRSNHGASLLRMVGLEDLSCDTEADYIDRAVALAADEAGRRRICEHLAQLAAAPVPVYYDTALFGSRVAAAFERHQAQFRRRYAVLAADGAALRNSVTQCAARVIGNNTELNALTDIGIIRLLIEPYFETPLAERPRFLIDVGACHGSMAAPLLAAGWHAALLEPDPAARQILNNAVSGFGAQIRVHGVAAGVRSTASVEFHQSATQGLSGFGDSPFGATAAILEVPCVTLADFCAEQAITSIDLLKIDAEGYDFEVLESLDFERVKPEIIMVEYGTHFARQTLEVVNAAINRMAARGYGSLAFAYHDDGNFRRSIWVYRLTGLFVDRPVAAADGEVFGNIVFYPAGDPRLLLVLQSLLDQCDAVRPSLVNTASP